MAAMLNVSAYSQHSLQKVTSPPTATSFAYPQSLFVDSQNGEIWVADFDNNRVLRFDVTSLTGVDVSCAAAPTEVYALDQNYPNPFNPATTITFAVKNTGYASVKVFNLIGQEVTTLFDAVAVAHEQYTLSFSAGGLSSGIYIYMLRSANGTQVKRMTLLK